MRIGLSIISVFLSTHIVNGQVNQPDSTALNESGISYSPITKANNQNATIGASFCKGVLKNHTSTLKEIGISPKILEKNCNCTVGDFDGNGYLDFAFWSIDMLNPTNQSGLNNYDYENYVVLFFKGEIILNSVWIKTEPGFPLVYYPLRQEIGPNGEPITKNESLWIWGESEGYDDYSKGTVFVYDKNESEFKTIEF